MTTDRPAFDSPSRRATAWARLFDEYERAHQAPLNRLVHYFVEPLIVASIPVIAVRPLLGVCVFAAGWATLWFSHLVFERNIPASWKQPWHVIVGPIWVMTQCYRALRPQPAAGRPPQAARADDSSRRIPVQPSRHAAVSDANESLRRAA